MFNVGDKVKFKKSSINTGMIDAVEEDVFTVLYVSQGHVMLTELGEWWNVGHFEHVKESAMTNTDDAMNNTEEQEIKWEVGQEVWCILRGKGVVHEIHNTGMCWSEGVDVYFTDYGVIRFKFDGSIGNRFNRSLFFSEPKIEAEKFPPKKLFVPTLKKGNVVAVKWADTVQILILEQETERQVKGSCGQVWDKDPDVHFYKLGEEIKFN